MRKEERASREKLKQFLRELSALTQKYNIEIGGSGVLGSPWVIVPGKRSVRKETLLEHLMYCSQHQIYGAYAEHQDCKRSWH
jgi:hypothetical protein